MHLLVLSAFRPADDYGGEDGCGLNAPFGAQCFPTGSSSLKIASSPVSMHLLVLSAFRPEAEAIGRTPAGRVSMHLLVLSAFRPK